jgi:Protein of unknown function (DUF2971)
MYKFYTISDIDFLGNIIGTKPTIKFSSAFNLNDPNELKFNIKLDVHSDEMKQRYFIDNPNASEKDYEDWKNQVSPNFIWYQEQEQRGIVGQLITLSCFTDSYNNNVMWSHYANNHQGICVEYKSELFNYLKSLKGFFAQNYVKYAKAPPEIDASRYRDEENIWKMIFTKQSEWSYEKEVRIVRLSNKDIEFIEFPQSLIKNVIVGSKAPEELINRVLHLCGGTNIDVYYAVNIGKSYEVSIVKHKERTMYMRSFW